MPVIRFPVTLMEQVAFRLRVLLEESDDATSEMRLALHRLEDAGICDFFIRLPCSVPQFVQYAITENTALRTSLSFQLREWRPSASESVQDLVSNLLPSDGHLD